MTPSPDRRSPATPAASRRGGFTLVEILVVITIIAVLTTLITVASVGFIGSAREAATRTTIKKVDEAILERVNAINRWHQRAIQRLRPDWEYRGFRHRWDAYQLTDFPQVADADAGRIVLSRKGMLLEILPVSQEELKLAYWFWARFDDPAVPSATIPSFRVINGVRVPYLVASEEEAMNAWLADIDENEDNNVAGTSPGIPSALDRPGEVFYYALRNAPVFGASRVGEDEFRPNELVDPDADGVPEIGDGWGRELRFYRWPTRLVNNYSDPSTFTWGDDTPRKTLMPNAPDQLLDLKVDPDDRAGYTAAPHPVWDLPIVMFLHDPNTWHAPLVVSAGPDGVLGLEEPNAETPPVMSGLPPLYGLAAPVAGETDALFDNVTNHTGRAGGPNQ